MNPRDKTNRWQPDVIPETLSGPNSLLQDSSGPVSLNDSLGPPSLQEESITEPLKELPASNVEEAVLNESAPNFPMYESCSSIDVSHDIDELPSSKLDASYSACDSGLIGILTVLLYSYNN